jgi:inorganic triphosphatase YgiF
MLRARHAPPIERELKFSLPAHAGRRVWRLVRPSVPQRRRAIDSVYFDTPERELHRRGAALRLRRDQNRWLQTLKSGSSALGGLARRECEVPAPRGRLDCTRFPRTQARIAAGFDLERVARSLRPVFRTRFLRTTGSVALESGARAEISVDHGSIEADGRRIPIHELELELKRGSSPPMLRLAERLVEPLGLALEFESKAERGYRLADGVAIVAPLKWPEVRLSRNATAAEAFTAVCNAALVQIGVNARAYARAGKVPEHLHQLRVGVRRLRSALRAFRRLLKAKKAREVDRSARRVMRVLGPARDMDVFYEGLDAWVRSGWGDPQGGARRLRNRARARRAAARRAARHLVTGPYFQRFQLGILRWLESRPWKSGIVRAEPLPEFGARSLDRLYRKVMRHARSTHWSEAKRRHEVRVMLKRLRYGCDYFAGCFARNATRQYLKRLAGLQDILGELNDLAVARGLLRGLALPGSERGVRDASRRIRRRLADRERKLIGALPAAWDALAAERPFWRSRTALPARG